MGGISSQEYVTYAIEISDLTAKEPRPVAVNVENSFLSKSSADNPPAEALVPCFDWVLFCVKVADQNRIAR